jgi:hypothetical protein
MEFDVVRAVLIGIIVILISLYASLFLIGGGSSYVPRFETSRHAAAQCER